MISTARGALGPAVITMLMLETVMKTVMKTMMLMLMLETVMKMRSVFVWHVARWQWHVALRAPRSAMTQCARRRRGTAVRYTRTQRSAQAERAVR